jgi:hypothetical protein
LLIVRRASQSFSYFLISTWANTVKHLQTQVTLLCKKTVCRHDTQRNDFQHNDCIQQSDTQHNRHAQCHYAECRILFIVMLKCHFLSIIMLSVAGRQYDYFTCSPYSNICEHGLDPAFSWSIVLHIDISSSYVRKRLAGYKRTSLLQDGVNCGSKMF